MEDILFPVNWQSAVVYLDDVFVFLKTDEQHHNHLQRVLLLLQDAGVTLTLKPCSLVTKTIKYFGHVICSGILEILEPTTDAIRQLYDLTTQMEIQ